MTASNLNNSNLGQVALLISMFFPPEPGGGANTAWNRALILNKMGHRVFVLCGFPSYPRGKVSEPKYKGKFFYVEKMEQFTLIRLRLLPLESKGYLKRFVLYINFQILTLFWMPRILKLCARIDSVYALAPTLFSSIIGFIYSKLTRSYFVYEVSAFWPEELVALTSHLYFILLFLGKILARISYNLPDMLVVISESAGKYVTINYSPNVLIYPLPIGVEPSKFPPISKALSRKKLIEKKIFPTYLENKFIVLYAGVITGVTKVENLLYAAQSLKDSENEIVVLVIGEGENKDRIKREAMTNNVNRLLLLPFQDGDLVPYILSAADVCVVSLSSEAVYETTIPTKFFDYIACCKAIIGICTGELANIINSSKIGVTVRDGEIDKLVQNIITLKNSPSLVRDMEKNTKPVLDSYSLDSLALKLKYVLNTEITRKKNAKFENKTL